MISILQEPSDFHRTGHFVFGLVGVLSVVVLLLQFEEYCCRLSWVADLVNWLLCHSQSLE
jgi:hypothetical protein